MALTLKRETNALWVWRNENINEWNQSRKNTGWTLKTVGVEARQCCRHLGTRRLEGFIVAVFRLRDGRIVAAPDPVREVPPWEHPSMQR